MNRILILCTGNSCRSQMAEGWFRHIAGDRLEVYSAGVEAHGLNPRAVKVMGEIGIDISGQTSNLVDDYRDVDFHYVITVCDSARERCPWFPSNAEKIHHSFPDPADATGSEEEILDVFRSVRDHIGQYAEEFANSLSSS
ncbi:MAG: arsenate reductase ArsC [Ignavibacteriae bacterium]|nr:arsenate reductase ArsC [Ignavibacteriota bacterium]MCB9214357.1 arsenate reductase ArsC [Ignavibacteria bacterium]